MLTNIHRPIVGTQASRYVLIMLVAFAVSVVATRLYLEATGYPQIGNATFHFAHALWGGLLQLIASLLLIIYVNRWIISLSAILAGVGVGLFIDEVGKFITQQNDYFFPLAAPIIYVAFLLTLLIYLIVKRRPVANTRAEMYQVLHELEEVLEDDLSASEHASMLARVRRIANQTERADLAELARHLDAFLQSSNLRIIPDREPFTQRLLKPLANIENRFISQKLARRILVALFLLNGLFTLFLLAILIGALTQTETILPQILQEIITGEANVTSASSLSWYIILIVLNLATGMLLLTGVVAFFMKRDAVAILLGVISLVVTLTFTNTLSFYFNQFSILLNSVYSFIALLALQRYRDRFLRSQEG
ncbi:MAG: hypothetical protein R3E39_04975 [Anaerolineae bacterium]